MSHGTDTRTLVLVGRTGNGKSATGNSILGPRTFKSKVSSSGVTSTAEMKSTTMHGNRVINVVDTPGLFDANVEADAIGKEIVKCVELAKDGIHALLLILSIKTRFSKEEESVLESLKTLFGSKITDYMIVVFTGGDELDEEEETIEDYLGRECPPPLQNILEVCGRRYVLFDNKTKDKGKKAEQLEALFDLVDKVVEANVGRPFINVMFLEIQEEARKLRRQQEEIDSSRAHTEAELAGLKKQILDMYETNLQQKAEMMELKVIEAQERIRLEQQLAEEQAARQKSDDEKLKHRKDVESLEREIKELQQKNEPKKIEAPPPSDDGGGGCEIL